MNGTGLFFVYETDLPSDTGYALFHREHLLIIALCFLSAFFCVTLYRKNTPRRKAFFRFLTGCFLLFLLLIRLFYVILCGAKLLYELPLHLCSLSGILCFIAAVLPEGDGRTKGLSFLSDTLGQVLFSLGMPGALLAILFPNGNCYPPVHFITIQSFLFHTLIIVYTVFILSDRKIRPGFSGAVKSILFLCVTVPFVFAFDLRFGTNYMFLRAPSPGSPVGFLMERSGYASYLSGYALITLSEIILINLAGSLTAGAGSESRR